MEDWLNNLIAALSAHAVTALALALVVVLLARMVRHSAIVHALWVVVLLKLVTPPILELAVLPLSIPESVQESLLPSSARAPGSNASKAPPPRPATDSAGRNFSLEPSPEKAAGQIEPPSWTWQVVLLLICGGGSLAVLTLALLRIRRFQSQLGESSEAPERIVVQTRELASQFGLNHPPPIRLVPARISPMLWPRPGGVVLLLPAGLLQQLTNAELDAVLGHELAHLRRRDHWVRFLELLVTVLFWWHPVVWWARRQLRRVEERSCDVWVAHALPDKARAYAEGLLKTMEFLAGHHRALPLVATGIDPQHDIKERLTMILTHKTPRILNTWHRLLLAGAALALLVIVPTRAPLADSEQGEALTSEEISFREQALDLDRQRLELEERMQELDAQQHQLNFERELRESGNQAAQLEDEVRKLEAAGAAEEVELRRHQQQILERESEMRREEFELQRQIMEDLLPLERELKAKSIQLEELAIQGDEVRVEALQEELRTEKKRLNELATEHQRRQHNLQQTGLEHRLESLRTRQNLLLEAGKKKQASKVAHEISRLLAESAALEWHEEAQATRVTQERRAHELMEKIERLKASGNSDAAKKLHHVLRQEKAQWEKTEYLLELEAHKKQMNRREKELLAEELMAKAEALRGEQKALSAQGETERAEALEKAKKMLKEAKRIE